MAYTVPMRCRSHGIIQVFGMGSGVFVAGGRVSRRGSIRFVILVIMMMVLVVMMVRQFLEKIHGGKVDKMNKVGRKGKTTTSQKKKRWFQIIPFR